MKEDNVFVRKSFAFAIQIVKASRLLVEHKKEYVLSKQLLRSGKRWEHLLGRPKTLKANPTSYISYQLPRRNVTRHYIGLIY